MCSLCRLPMGKNHNFGQILTIWGLLYRPPFTDEGQIWCPMADPRSTFTCEISSRSVYSVVLWLRNTQILPFFGLRHLVMLPIGSSLRKLNTGAQLQTFPYPMHQSRFCTPTPSWRNHAGVQTLTFTSVSNKQTSSYAAWFTDGGAIRIGHYDVIDDVITRKL